MILEEDLSNDTVTYANRSEVSKSINNNKVVGLFLRDIGMSIVSVCVRVVIVWFMFKKLEVHSEEFLVSSVMAFILE